MRKANLLCLLIVVTGSSAGCGKADTGGTGGNGGSGGGAGSGDMASASTGDPALVGTWLSTGANLAKGFTTAPFSYTSITGDFKADATYTVVGTDSSGKMSTLAGTWQASPSSVAGIFDFTQSQTSPSTATAKGIYRIDATVTPNRLTLEGVQTMPSLNATPPTAEGGFGSTTVSGTKTSDWVQTYERQ